MILGVFCNFIPAKIVVWYLTIYNARSYIYIFPKTKKDLVVFARQCCLFCLLKS